MRILNQPCKKIDRIQVMDISLRFTDFKSDFFIKSFSFFFRLFLDWNLINYSQFRILIW